MPPRIPTAAEVARQQARAIRAALAAAPGSPAQTRALAAASMLGQSITPLSQPEPTQAERIVLNDIARVVSGWTDIHFCDGAFAGAVQALTAGLQEEAA